MIQHFGPDQNILTVIGLIFFFVLLVLLGGVTDIHDPKTLNSNDLNSLGNAARLWMDGYFKS